MVLIILKLFSQMQKLNTVRVLLSVVMNKDWPLYQLDVKNALFEWRLGRGSLYDEPFWGFEAQFDH